MHTPSTIRRLAVATATVAGALVAAVAWAAPASSAPSAAGGAVSIGEVSLRGTDSWSSWLGGAPVRTLQFTVTNTGESAITEMSLVLSGDSDRTVGPVAMEPLQAGEHRLYAIRVEFGALAFGEQRVQAHLLSNGAAVPFAATTSSYPWLLILLPALALWQLTLVGVRRHWLTTVLARIRSRRDRPVVVSTGFDDVVAQAFAHAFAEVFADQLKTPRAEAEAVAEPVVALPVVMAELQAVYDELSAVLTVPEATEVEPEFDPQFEPVRQLVAVAAPAPIQTAPVRLPIAPLRRAGEPEDFLALLDEYLALEPLDRGTAAVEVEERRIA